MFGPAGAYPNQPCSLQKQSIRRESHHVPIPFVPQRGWRELTQKTRCFGPWRNPSLVVSRLHAQRTFYANNVACCTASQVGSEELHKHHNHFAPKHGVFGRIMVAVGAKTSYLVESGIWFVWGCACLRDFAYKNADLRRRFRPGICKPITAERHAFLHTTRSTPKVVIL